ncbi:hypothetical protein HZA71_00180, partial [Candidatus Falkowbacteria bacterium]|nr:hypothetical protein [Candidatus Falkowbacteria bacterium]
MKKELVLILLLLVLIIGCTQKSSLKVPEEIEQTSSTQAAADQNMPEENLAEQKDDPSFNLPPDEDSLGWKQTSGPLGGVVNRMIPYDGTVWASLYSGGIYELQADDSWKQIAVGHGIPEVRAFDIVVNPSNTNIAYVPEMLGCVAKTTNKGVDWRGLCDNVVREVDNTNFNSHTLALDPTDPNVIYLPGHPLDQTSMFLVSMDEGEHWEKRFTFDKHYDFNHLFFFGSKMYLATREGVLISSDQGKSWAPFNDGLENLKTAQFVNFKNTLYLLGAELQYNVRMGGNLYRLADDGLSWKIVPGLEQVTGIGTDGTTIFVGTWNPEPKLWVSTDGNLFQEKTSENLPHTWFGEIVSLNSKIYVGTGGDGIYVSSDNGDTFKEFNKGVVSIATREVYVNPADENEIYVGTWDRLGFYWSKNGGKGYKRLATDLMIFTLLPDPHNFSIVYLGGEDFFKGTVHEKSSTFVQKNKPGSVGSATKSIAVDPKNSDHILIGIGESLAEAPPGEGLWESYDGGESWTRAQGIGDFAVYSIIFHPNDPQIVYASALGAGVFKSTDGGSHFMSLGNGELKYTYRLAMSSSDPDVIVASSNLFFGQL